MAFANGWEHAVYAGGAGFGLGFLNFLGTVLFIVLAIGFFRAIARRGRWRRSAMQAGGSNGPTGSGPTERGSEWWGEMRSWWDEGRCDRRADAAAVRSSGHRTHAKDEAMQVARKRLAEGEIDAEAFAVLRDGLERGSGDGSFDDAVTTLRMRFAQGDIDRTAFDTSVDALR